MLPWNSIIKLSKNKSRAIYLQIADALIIEILNGRISKGYKMPGGRSLSQLLHLNRKTVMQAYDELLSQGWIEIIPSKGTFVKNDLPLSKPKKIHITPNNTSKNTFIENLTVLPFSENNESKINENTIDDGSPDYRLAPMDLLYKVARYYTKGRIGKSVLLNSSSYGEITLRETLVKYLSNTRALNGSIENILITRGSQMALYLIFNLLIKKGDNIIIGELNYKTTNTIIKLLGGNLIKTPLDNTGLDIGFIENCCQTNKIKAIYITPHHHFPTTVIMPVNKRLQLLNLSYKYNFAIIEDDYDYDYHYARTPILPLASLDKSGNTIYIGSFSKILVPSVRIGYMFAHPKIIQESAKLRRYIDKQGDPIIERSLAHLIQENEISRHLKKAVNAYKIRRDLFCAELENKFKDLIHFTKPEGGMAIWANFNPGTSVKQLVVNAEKKNLYLNIDCSLAETACRLGFASTNEKEIIRNLEILKILLS
jgi:GntR family transcriptional regulator/MocR family aminotransferase